MPDSIQRERFLPRGVTEQEGEGARGRGVRLSQGTAALREIAGVMTASRLERPVPAMVSSGVAEVDQLTGGIPRGALTEIVGPASSGRTTCLIAAIAEATQRGEVCAVVDTTDAFDPHSAMQAGVDLDRVLWVRCSGSAQPKPVPSEEMQKDGQQGAKQGGENSRAFLSHASEMKPWTGAWPRRPPARSERQSSFDRRRINAGEKYLEIRNHEAKSEALSIRSSGFRERWAGRLEQVLKATDMLLQSGGFGLVAVDFGDVPVDAARRVPLTSWFRFRRAVENTPTVLLVVEQEASAKSCASLVLSLHGAQRRSAICDQDTKRATQINGASKCPEHARLLDGITVTVEVVRGERKPVRSARTEFESRTAWAG